jgi:hypothetical protein
MTAEEFLNNKFKEIYKKQPKGLTDNISEKRYLELHVTGRIDGREQNYPEMMIEFAKMHCKEQAKIIAEKQKGYWYNGEFINGCIISKDSILNAYPESNIV